MGAKLTKTSGTDLIVAGLTNIGEIGGESSEIDVTSLDSPNDYKEYLLGIKDAGEVAIEGVIKNESNVSSFLALYEGQTLESWEVEFKSGAKWFFEAFVKMFKEGAIEPNGARKFKASLRISGRPVYASNGISV